MATLGSILVDFAQLFRELSLKCDKSFDDKLITHYGLSLVPFHVKAILPILPITHPSIHPTRT